MRIPTGKNSLIKFVREVVDECLISQHERLNQYANFTGYALAGSENPSDAALYNKTFAYLDDLESLLYSPISLRFNLNDPDVPNVLAEAKGRAAAAKLRALARRSDTDTTISSAVWWSLVKGKTLIKQLWNDDGFSPNLIQPDSFGVFKENHEKLDQDMEAFCHSQLITPYQFQRMIWNKKDKAELLKKSKKYLRQPRGPLSEVGGAQKQVIVGGLYPFQPAGANTPQKTRGIVDWMGGPNPMLSPKLEGSLLQLDELWVWNDEQDDWATFQTIGDDIFLMGRNDVHNAYAWDPGDGTPEYRPRTVEQLKGKHPFHEFTANPLAGYFWGRSELFNVALLQEAINSRINGINKILRLDEDRPMSFTGFSGINQSVVSRFQKPGGWLQESNPNAAAKSMAPELNPNLFASLHEYERMFDEMGGLPPVAKGHGESGVRSQGHAETLVRMFSPRFKDRALLVERDVEGLAGGMLDLAKVKVSKKLIAWVPAQAAGLEAPEPEEKGKELFVPPVPGQVPVFFRFADLHDDMTLSIDAHSSSPAFSEEAKALLFSLLKVGAMGPEDVVMHTDAPDPEELVAGIQRRQQAKAQQEQQAQVLKLEHGGGGRSLK